jgi:hypothetical protein
MLKSYEAIYSCGYLRWINQSAPDLDKETRVVVVMDIHPEPQKTQETIRELLKRTRGSMGRGKTLDEIDAEIRTMRHEWERDMMREICSTVSTNSP